MPHMYIGLRHYCVQLKKICKDRLSSVQHNDAYTTIHPAMYFARTLLSEHTLFYSCANKLQYKLTI